MRTTTFVSSVVFGLLLNTHVSFAQPPGQPPGQSIRPQIHPSERRDLSPALRDLPPLPVVAANREPHEPMPVRRGPGRRVPQTLDPALQAGGFAAAALAPLTSFEGVNNVNSVLPPDTNGDIGPNHYVQWVNLSFAVYNRAGTRLYGPASGATLWQGFGGPCQTQNDGDPIVLYDEHADRWLMTQFALPNFPSGPYYQCIAVSQTADPLGAYYRYQFSFSKMNDYPKFGVWGDGYYMSINQFTCNIIAQCSWAGEGVAAFPRAQMLTGAPATMIYFDMAAADTTLGGMLPSDLDGPAPPAGTPNYFVQFDDDAWGYSGDQLQVWEFRANWAAPATSTFTKKAALPTSPFNSDLCGYSRNCIPQAGTTRRLDAISDRVMYRLQYRNFGNYGTLVTNHSVDVTGSDLAGVRWYELRLVNGTPSIFQQGTFSPDSNHRWMGSAAMDKAGNIAIGYNVSNTQTFPRISFTGRKAGDAAGQMTLAEGDIFQGSGSQTSTSSRWGDYSNLTVDPVDGCTFWFTTEYLAATSSSGWRTRIGSFKIDGCDGGGGGGSAPAAPSGVTATPVSTSQINLAWTDNSSNEDNFFVDRCTGAGCTPGTQIAQLNAGTTTFNDTGLATNTPYGYRIRAVNAIGSSSSDIAYATTAPAGYTHVASLTSTTSKKGQNWKAEVTIRVVDQNNASVANATVTGAWSLGSSDATCVTNANGACTVTSGNMRGVSITFTVTNITHATLAYNAAANVQTSITVNKP